MADLCLTSNQGTVPLGLYRGLNLAVSDLNCRARIADRDPRFWTTKDQLPNVAVLQFRQGQSSHSMRGFNPPSVERHAVVVHSRTSDGEWLVADPAVGWRRFDDEMFRAIFTGDAIYLQSR